MNKHEWIAGILAEKHKKPLPILSYPAIQKLGTTVRELIMSSTLQARGMKIVADSFPTLASVSLMDLSVEAECFGANIIVSDGEVPTVSGALVTTPEEAAALKVPPLSAGRAGLYVDEGAHLRPPGARGRHRSVFARGQARRRHRSHDPLL